MSYDIEDMLEISFKEKEEPISTHSYFFTFFCKKSFLLVPFSKILEDLFRIF